MSQLPTWLLRQMEVDPKRFLPYAGHVCPDTVLLMDNSVLAMIYLHGLPFELQTMQERLGRRDRINTLLRSLADSDRTLHLHMVRHLGTPQAPQPSAASPFVSGLMAAYDRAVFKSGKVFRNDWFISVIVRQPPDTTSHIRKLRGWLPFRKATKPLSLSETARQSLEDVCQVIQSTLADYRPRRLGLIDLPTEREDITLPVTEIGTALHLIRTAHLRPIPHTTGALAAAIYTSPVVCSHRWFDLNIAGLARIGAMIGFGNYPARPRIGMFNKLLSTPYPCVMSHSYRYRSTGAAVSAMRLVKQQMENSSDAAEDLAKGIKDAANATASMKTASGLHHFGLAVYAESLAQLDRNVADAINRLAQFGGAAPLRETNVWYNGALETAYYLQMPGCSAFKPRPGTVSTLDLADMTSLDNFPTGDVGGYWGPSPIRFLTNGLTTYDFVPHDEDVGHFGIYGRIGSGKTALLGMLLACFEPIMGADGIRLVIDKDEGNKLLIEAADGVYTTLRRNQPSGLAPLVAFANTPRNQAFLHRLYSGLILRDGRSAISQDEDDRLMRGIARQLQMPPETRSMWGIREFLGYYDRENGAGTRFERYCAGRSMGWLLDNRRHVISMDAGLYGFDFTDLIPKDGEEDDGACSVAAAVIMHQLADLMDGRKIVCACDEFALLHGATQAVDRGLLAHRPEKGADARPAGTTARAPYRHRDGHVARTADADQVHLPRR